MFGFSGFNLDLRGCRSEWESSVSAGYIPAGSLFVSFHDELEFFFVMGGLDACTFSLHHSCT